MGDENLGLSIFNMHSTDVQSANGTQNAPLLQSYRTYPSSLLLLAEYSLWTSS